MHLRECFSQGRRSTLNTGSIQKGQEGKYETRRDPLEAAGTVGVCQPCPADHGPFPAIPQEPSEPGECLYPTFTGEREAGQGAIPEMSQ